MSRRRLVILMSFGGLILIRYAPLWAASWMTAKESGGAATTDVQSRSAFTQHAPDLPLAELPTFAFGNRIFSTPWVEAPASVVQFDGLGPFFSSRSCSGCHLRDGRGRPPESASEVTSSMIVKLGLADRDRPLGPDPIYGAQLSERALQGLTPEGRLAVHWEERSRPYPDSQPLVIRAPRYAIEELAYGALADRTRYSPRIAPAVIGVGLLEAVPDSLLIAREDPDDSNGDGISGRIHWVEEVETGQRRIGRLGWKATEPTVADQISTALANDMGITTALHPEIQLAAVQAPARERPSGGSPKLAGAPLQALLAYCRLLAVPARRNLEAAAVLRGAERFRAVGCIDCHVPELAVGHTAHPALAGQPIHPYTDLNLHDMGPELSDGMPEGNAAPAEWRTPPLWGLGLAERVDGYRFLLHDGRARTPEEAILWHGGEGSASRESFRRLPARARADLLAFLESL